MRRKTVLMAVGSSGGHIYPALAVAQALEEISEGHKTKPEIHFVHAGSLLGKKLFSSLKYPVYEIPIGGLAQGQKFLTKIKSLLQLPQAFWQSLRLIKKLKAEVIVGTGGAVTGPVLMAGFLTARQTALWEGNAQAGLANRWLSPFVSLCWTVFPGVEGLPKKKQTICGYPLRKKLSSLGQNPSQPEELLNEESQNFKMMNISPRKDSHQEEFLNEESPGSKEGKSSFKVLVLGGSQGSVFLNQVVSQALEDEKWREDIFIFHQTGEKSLAKIKEKYKCLSHAEAFAFSLNLEKYYKQCDLVVSRAGSGAIWETASYGKALVLVPLSHSAGGHQLKNALELASRNSAEMIKEKDFSARAFKSKIISLKENKKRREELAQSLKALHKENGARDIARWILY